MSSKSEDGTTLDRKNRDVRSANKMLMDNGPEQTGYKTEMKRAAILKRMKV